MQLTADQLTAALATIVDDALLPLATMLNRPALVAELTALKNELAAGDPQLLANLANLATAINTALVLASYAPEVWSVVSGFLKAGTVLKLGTTATAAALAAAAPK